MKTIIIGGVAAGMSAATRLRRLQEDAEITVYEMGPDVSYANCGLPYFISDTISDRASLLLQTPASLNARFKLDVKTSHKVVAIDKEAKRVTVQNLLSGETFEDKYDALVLATGAKPRKPNIPGIENALTLRDVEDADVLKAAVQKSQTKTAVIIGGGFIGIETAENLVHAGFTVHLVQRSSQLLSLAEPEIVEVMQKHLEANGIKLHLNADLTEITDSTVTVNGTPIVTELVISAAGVEPDNQLAKDAGLRFGETGGLWVNEQQRTSDPHIYAAGDAVEKHDAFTDGETLVPLANLANRHGRLIADVIAGLPVKVANTISTAIIGAFGMALATTGLSPAKAKAKGIAHEVIHLHPGSHAGYYPGAKRISMLVVFEPGTGKLLGAQAVGEDGVDKRIDVIATAMHSSAGHGGLTIDDLMDLELAYAPQFGSAKDAINIAGYVGNNVFNGTTPTVQWHELEAVRAAGAQVIDVRSGSEHGNGHIPGTLNIPVEELRDRLDEVQLENVVVYCQVGQRGHIATQILKANGAKVRNLDGGYVTWSAGTHSQK